MSQISNFIFFYLFFLLILVMVFTLFLLGKHLLNMKQNNKWEKRRARIKSILEEYLTSPTSFPPRIKGVLKGKFRDWILKQLIELRDKNTLNSEKITKLLKSWGYIDVIHSLLHDHRTHKKFEGLYLVSVLELRHEKDLVIQLLSNHHSLIRLKAFWTMGAIGDNSDLPILAKYLENEKYDVSKLESILHILGGLSPVDSIPTHKLVVDTFNITKDPFVQRCLVELIGRKQCFDSIPFLLEISQKSNPELRIGAIKSLIELRDTSAISSFIQLLKWSESIGVKIISMKGIALIGNIDHLPVFRENLGHSLWWVRYYSAFGMARLGEDGKGELNRLAVTYSDQYGREMANYFLQILDNKDILWDSDKQNFMIF
jgi:HEAT repeat protein